MNGKEISPKILEVDLSSNRGRVEVVDRGMQQDFIGGFGIGVKLIYDCINPELDSLDPGNPIILSAGSLGGTIVPSSSRVSVITKYPLTKAVAMGNGGMRLGQKLKTAGFEHVIIRGKAEIPSVLKIFDNQFELVDARDLWGKDLYETTDLLWSRFGFDWSVLAIGQAGENLVNISMALIDKIASVGKGGLAAVMGSKNLKAIIANGVCPVRISDADRFIRAVNAFYNRFRAMPNRDKHIELGVYWKWDQAMGEGWPMRGGNEIFPKERATELYGKDIYMHKIKKGRLACPSCPLPDKEIMEIKDGEFEGLVTYGSGFVGRAKQYGVKCGAGTYDRVLKIHDLANRLGICSHAFSSLFDFAVSLFEKGRIDLKDTMGVKLQRDFETTRKVMEMTSCREGFGDVMANGYNAFFNRFGEDLKDDALQAKGMDMLYEPRLSRLNPKTFMMVVNPRGGHHQPGTTPADFPGKTIDELQAYCRRTGVSEEAIKRIFSGPQKANMARLSKHSQEFYGILSSLGICSKAPMGLLYDLDDCSELYSSASGVEISPTELKRAGERIWNLYKMINVREGFDKKNDLFPSKWLISMKGEKVDRPLVDYFETKCLTVEDLRNLLYDYYDECGWDRGTGVPTREKLQELGLLEIIGV